MEDRVLMHGGREMETICEATSAFKDFCKAQVGKVKVFDFEKSEECLLM